MEYKLVIDQKLVDEYNTIYKKKNPRTRKPAIEKPKHPSINEWMILRRPMMNALKQRWKAFVVWLVKKYGYENLMLDNFNLTSITYNGTRHRFDPDNSVPKFILDGMTEAGMIVDDDGKHLHSLTLIVDYDKDNPRTEIIVKTIDE